MTPRTSNARAFAALATAGCLWGTGFLFGKWALTELSVSLVFVLGAIIFAVALVGAIYLDGGIEPAEKFIAREFSTLIEEARRTGAATARGRAPARAASTRPGPRSHGPRSPMRCGARTTKASSCSAIDGIAIR